jgi:hypothetical protein
MALLHEQDNIRALSPRCDSEKHFYQNCHSILLLQLGLGTSITGVGPSPTKEKTDG